MESKLVDGTVGGEAEADRPGGDADSIDAVRGPRRRSSSSRAAASTSSCSAGIVDVSIQMKRY